MGTAPKRLVILVLPPLETWPEVETLRAQGHTIFSLASYITSADTAPRLDLILGPEAWRMTEAHRKYLPLAIAAARRLKYPPKKGEVDDG